MTAATIADVACAREPAAIRWADHHGRLAPRVLVLAGGGIAHTSGGVGTMMLNLMDEWARRANGPQMRVMDTRGQGGRPSGAVRFGWCVLQVVWLCALRRIDLVHAHMTTRGSVGRKGVLCSLAQLMGVPVVLHMHGADFLAFHGRLPAVAQRLVLRVLRRASRVVVLGRGWRDFLVAGLGLDPARVEIVLNGVPRPAACASRQAGPLRILFIGRIGDRKGVPELVAALGTPALRARAWQATIAGDGEVARFQALVAGRGLAGRVALPGWMDRAQSAKLMAQADILVLPSHDEALPMAVIEALAAGVAVITTPVGAIPEFLTDGVDALLVPAGCVAALAGALARLIDDGPTRNRLGRAGRAVFAARLDVAVTAGRMLAVYHDAWRGADAGAAALS